MSTLDFRAITDFIVWVGGLITWMTRLAFQRKHIASHSAQHMFCLQQARQDVPLTKLRQCFFDGVLTTP